MAIDIATGLVMIGAAASIVGAAIATGIAQASIGSAAMGLLAEKPEASGQAILFIALPETILIFGFVIAILMLLGVGFI